MTARHLSDRNRDGFIQQKKMTSQTQKATGGNSAPYRPADQYTHPTFVDPVTRDSAGSTCYGNVSDQDALSHSDRIKSGQRTQRKKGCTKSDSESLDCTSHMKKDIPEQLLDLISTMITTPDVETLVDAFRSAPEYPPITKQTLSELDIHNITRNIKLRHDVNFDRDLSFRPNLDGSKGQEKVKEAKKYWNALIAELELYTRLFQGTPPMLNPNCTNWPLLVEKAMSRIPKMFETIREILKSLVPERDQSRVDEHLDIPMLKQGIEKGVCDLLRLSEWMANLLKEHCAPMRDEWVDKMVDATKFGVECRSSESIVKGLRDLLGILEAMKLDVANHQIRNLKAMLIDDTVDFERRWHLQRIIPYPATCPSKFGIEGPHNWYQNALALQRARENCNSLPKDHLRFHLEALVRAVLCLLFSDESVEQYPETFHLDRERLQVLKSELHSLVFLDICSEVFDQLLKQKLDNHGPASQSEKQVLQASLSAIIGEGYSLNPLRTWQTNSEHLALELVRHALCLSGRQSTYDAYLVTETTECLQRMFETSFDSHIGALERTLVPTILTTVTTYLHSSSLDLFNALVSPTASSTLPSLPFSQSATHSRISPDRLSPPADSVRDITNRLSHILILHWHIWGPIAYLLPDAGEDSPTSTPIEQDSNLPCVQPQSAQPKTTTMAVTEIQPPAPAPQGQELDSLGTTSEASSFD